MGFTALAAGNDMRTLLLAIETALEQLRPQIDKVLTDEGIDALALSAPPSGGDRAKEF